MQKDVFSEIIQYHRSTIPLSEKYARLYNLLDRVCKEMTADFPTDFSNLFSRLYALCKHTAYQRGAIEYFRMNARRILRKEVEPEYDDYLYDLKAVAEAVSHFYGIPIPHPLESILPAKWRPQPSGKHYATHIKQIRVVVDHWDDSFIYGFDEQHPTEQPLVINFSENNRFANTYTLLYRGAQMNLLNVGCDGNDTFYPELFVLEPDFLIDISALAECYQSYGNHPANYLIQKFRPKETTHQILLGNAANQFLDDCVNEQPDSPATYEHSIQKVFSNEPLNFSTCEKIDREFFNAAQQQFGNIRQTIRNLFESSYSAIDKKGALLEPSFLCESMGLQGRMDYLQGDFRYLIELKSGKAEEWGQLRSKENHALQMALYKEVLYYNLDIKYDQNEAYLFYSRYPKLFAERSSKAQIQEAINLRNRIVAQELELRHDGGETLLKSITPDMLNTRNCQNRLWRDFQKPQLEQFIAPFHQADDVTLAYFHTFTAFVEREQFLAKTGDIRAESNHGFANTWNTDTPTKLATGDILTDLKIKDFSLDEGIEKVMLEIPAYDENFLPNFRLGDIVLLYERNSEQDTVTNKLVIRGTIEKLTTDTLVILLRNKQRNPQIFNTTGNYAIEHDFMDASFNNLYKGLYTLLTTPKQRQDLLLCRRSPKSNPTISLNRHYLNAQIDEIVLQAKQAEDYFLLVGPPGTGKTSVALRSMVEEYMSEEGCNLLLLSYTNRAVDEICEMLESITPTPNYMRIGSEATCEPRFRPHLMKNLLKEKKRRNDIHQTIAEIRIIAGTTSSISGHPELFKLKHFQVAIVDESSQILEPQIIGILCAHDGTRCAIDKFILIGDHKQLPAVVMQRTEDSAVSDEKLKTIGLTNCRNSLFERLYQYQQDHPTQGITQMLNRQGRMHPDISSFVNLQFYDGQLDIVPVKHQQATLEWDGKLHHNHWEELVANNRLCFIDTPYPPLEDSNKVNRHEAKATALLVSAIYNLCQQNGLPFDAVHRIGIIVPFRNQIARIAHELAQLNIPETEQISIDTVERYQGSQRDIIIYNTTISQPYQLDILSVTAYANGKLIDRKLNVALTRARKQLFVIGNSDLLNRNGIYNQLIASIRQEGRCIKLHDL